LEKKKREREKLYQVYLKIEMNKDVKRVFVTRNVKFDKGLEYLKSQGIQVDFYKKSTPIPVDDLKREA
jgi:hypothetical protein